MSNPVKIILQPDGKTLFVPSGTTIMAAVEEAGINLNAPCGGKGNCGKCKIEVTLGDVEYSQPGAELLSDEEIKNGFRLACQSRILEDTIVNIPPETRSLEQKILVEGTGVEVELEPSVRKQYIQVPEPSLDDQSPDLSRILASLNGSPPVTQVELDILRDIPEKVRRNEFAVTAVLYEDKLIGIEDGDTSAKSYGVAFDIGTTTVVGSLLDLKTGEQIAVATRTNPQISYGDDVVSRINYSQEKENGLNDLHECIIGCVNGIIEELASKAGIEREVIYEATFVGNTTMNHLFLRVDPKYIALAPYVAAVGSPVNIRPSELGLTINRNGNIYAIPNIAGFVGGDTVGVILAADLMHSDKIKLAIDIGTNGEVVLGSKDRLISCSTAAGPAFEGARIKFGMRASNGAIERVLIDEKGDVVINTIGGKPAIGICGTGLIDVVAELLRVGIIDPMGRLLDQSEAQNSAEAAARRVVAGENGNDFILVNNGSGDSDAIESSPRILLTQRDIREVQLAKGAIYAGIQILKTELGITDDDISEVLLAGAFGNYIRPEMAKRVGLLPNIPTEKIKFIGNAAGAGSKMVLTSRKCKEEAIRVSNEVEYIELAGRPDFQQEFMSAMLFPESV